MSDPDLNVVELDGPVWFDVGGGDTTRIFAEELRGEFRSDSA